MPPPEPVVPYAVKFYFLDGRAAPWGVFFARMWLATFSNLTRRQRQLLRKGINPY